MLSGNCHESRNRVGGASERESVCPRCNDRGGRRWNALDPSSQFPFSNDDAQVSQEADQFSGIEQRSREVIVVKDSCDINVTSTETQVAVSLQAALQVAIALVVNLTIADSNQAEKVTQDLLQFSRIEQVNRQSVYIENSRDVDIQMTDTDIAVSLQLMLQLLLALLVQIDVF
ncbi:spore coat protein [Bacillus dakarensis]|uniref:spore coat protein n=1 Tax=Robertmurraya dakarensis TaxID=1926278 RepID=UPI000A0790D4|nr:spore coat protein [Bacillus dakarensis]